MTEELACSDRPCGFISSPSSRLELFESDSDTLMYCASTPVRVEMPAATATAASGLATKAAALATSIVIEPVTVVMTGACVTVVVAVCVGAPASVVEVAVTVVPVTEIVEVVVVVVVGSMRSEIGAVEPMGTSMPLESTGTTVMYMAPSGNATLVSVTL